MRDSAAFDCAGVVTQAWAPRLEPRRLHSCPEEPTNDDPKLPLTPEQRIKELEEKLALVNQKAQFFEAVVDVLKNDYGVSVVKKRSGKSSPKGKSKV